MSEIREEILFNADDDFWRSWIENREMLAEAKDSEAAYPRHRREAYSVSTPLGRRSCFCLISAAGAIGYKKFYLENPARSFSIVHYHS
jgi:hypothetical protein